MGQAISVGADNVATFKRMVKCCYYGDLKKLKKFKHEKCMTYQISRAAYLNWCQNQQANIHAIIDSLEKERANDKFIQEKMEFFNAVENQQLGLGDTLLHVAVRRGHVDVMKFLLLQQNLREDIPNFQGHTVIQCCSSPSFQLVIEDVISMHSILGFDFEEHIKVVQLLESLRKIWPHFMYAAEEAPALLKVIYNARSTHPSYQKLLKVCVKAAERYCYRITHRGLSVAAQLLQENYGQPYLSKEKFEAWTDEAKLDILMQCFEQNFIDWQYRQDVNQQELYLNFVNKTMDTWIEIAQELRLDREDSKFPTMGVLEKHQPMLWAERLHPPAAELQAMCVHINGLEQHVHLTGLRVQLQNNEDESVSRSKT